MPDDLCPTCGAYWDCDCLVYRGPIETLLRMLPALEQVRDELRKQAVPLAGYVFEVTEDLVPVEERRQWRDCIVLGHPLRLVPLTPDGPTISLRPSG